MCVRVTGCSVTILLTKNLGVTAPPEPETAEAAAEATLDAEAKLDDGTIPDSTPPEPISVPSYAPAAPPRVELVQGEASVGFAPVLLKEKCGGVVSEAVGTQPPCAAEDWRVIFRQTVRVPELGAGAGDVLPAARVWATLTLPQPDIAKYVRFYTVNNDTGDVAAHALLTTGEQPLVPNVGGYSFMATIRNRFKGVPAFQWRLSVMSDVAITPLQPSALALKGPATLPSVFCCVCWFVGGCHTYLCVCVRAHARLGVVV